MFAVFYKGEFINWWHNKKTDTEWIERTISAMGWDARYVQVSWFDQRPQGIFTFDDFKNIKTVERKKVEIEVDETDAEGKVKKVKKEQEIFEPDVLPVRAQIWFDEGERKKGYDSV
jgi:hypothetical protein